MASLSTTQELSADGVISVDQYQEAVARIIELFRNSAAVAARPRTRGGFSCK